MNICEIGHSEIVFNEMLEKRCPLCRSIIKIEELEIEVKELKDEIYGLKKKEAENG